MNRILGKEYMTRKEAAHRYGLSIAWFKLRQQKHEEPYFIKIGGRGRTFYDVEYVDNWFRSNMKECE